MTEEIKVTEEKGLAADRWQQIDQAFQQAVELGGTALQQHLAELGASDPGLAEEVRSLLAVDTGLVGRVVARAADGAVRQVDSV